MLRHLVIVSPEYAPIRGGVGDHTFHLARELSREAIVTVIASAGAEPNPTFEVRGAVRQWGFGQELLGSIRELPAEAQILWQYVPFMYGRGGASPQLIRTVRRLRREGRQQLLIAHELAVPWTLRPRGLVYAIIHRWQWRVLANTCQAAGVSTETWLRRAQQSWPHLAERLFLAHSPASVPLIPVPPDHRIAWRRRHQLPDDCLVIGFFGTLHPGKQFPLVLRAWETARRTVGEVALVLVGSKPDYACPPENQRWHRALGYLDATEASLAFQAADLLGLPFLDGVSERRSSFMTAIEHGCPVLTTLGHNTGPQLRSSAQVAFAAAPVEEPTAWIDAMVHLLHDSSRRRELGAEAQRLSQARYSWPALTRSIMHRLRP